MPWLERTVEEMREEFAKRVLSKEKTKAALCREYGISRPTGDKWIERYLAGEKLSDRSRAPHNRPNHVDEDVEQMIVDMRRMYPAQGALKIHRMLSDEGKKNLPSVKTINNIFHRNGLITPEATLAATPYKRFEKSYPNEMLQCDFKGCFKLQNGNYCHPLCITDDNTRYSLCCEAMEKQTFAAVKPVVERVFKEYGVPFSFLCDNGNPWGVAQERGYTKFEVWMMEHGVLVLHGRGWHPQTQGKQERFNGSLKKECLRFHDFADIEEAQLGFDEYRKFYNEKRPHHALELATPASRYTMSERKYSDTIEEWDYPPEYEVVKVKGNGYFRYNEKTYFLSEGFADKYIAVRESHLPGQITLVFRQFRIGRIDVSEGGYTMKRAYLLDGDPRLCT